MSGRPEASERSGYPLTRAHRLAWLGALAASGWAGDCMAAEVEASASVDSDYQWQGLSLSSGKPAASVTVSGEFGGGAYGSLTGVVGATDHDGVRPLAYIADFGFAQRFGQGASWELGVVASGVRLYQNVRYRFTYAQVYGGLSKGDISARLFYSPSYLGESAGSLYLDLDGALHPAPHWRLVAHAGFLATLHLQSGPLNGPDPQTPTDRDRIDLRAGVVREFGNVEGHLFLTTTVPNPLYPTGNRQPNRTVMIGATYTF